MSNVIYREIDEAKPVIYTGTDSMLFVTGRGLLDMSSSACFATLGHSNRKVIDAIYGQLRTIPYAFSGYWATEAAERASNLIAAAFNKANPGWFGKCIFLQTGGEAVDLACRLASQYHMENEEERVDILSRRYSFHGVGLLPSVLSDDYPRYELMNAYLDYASMYTPFKMPHTYDSKIDYCMQWTKNKTNDDTAAIIIEPVSGPPLGAYVETKEYMRGLREICDDTGTLLIYDEVLCGAGRCGYMSTAELYGVWPDIVILGKGISAGYQPVSVICVSEKVVDRIRGGSGRLMFGTTYSAHTAGCAAVEATLTYINDNNLMRRVRDFGEPYEPSLGNTRSRMETSLRGWLMHSMDTNIVKEIRGTGFLWGVEFQDPKTGLAFAPKLEFHKKVRDAVMEQGAVVYTKGGTVDGKGDFMTIAPPFEMTPSEMEVGFSMIRQGIERAYKRVTA